MSESLQKLNSSAIDEPSIFNKTVFFLLAVVLVVSTAAFGSVDFWALGLNAFFAGLIIIFWTADALSKREFRFQASLLQIPALGLILIGLIQLLPLRSPNLPPDLLSVPAVSSISLAPYATRLALVQLVVYFIFFAAALTFINSKKRLQKIIITIIAFGALMAFFGILQRLANIEAIYGLRSPGQAFAFSAFVNQHHFAAFMEMTIGLTLGLLFGKATRTNKRFFLLFAVVVMGMGLIFTSSRGGMISLLTVIAFVVTAILRQKPLVETDREVKDGGNNRRVFLYVGGGLVLILILFVSVLLLGGNESLTRGVGITNLSDASNGRFHFWSVAWKIFLDHPIIGAGLDAFGTVFPSYDSWNGFFRVEQAHNDYLQILADAGISGFICAAAFIFLLFKKGFSLVKNSTDRFGRGAATGALAGCFGILIHSFFDFPLRTSSNMFFFLTLTVIATNLIAQEKTSRKRRVDRFAGNL